HRGCSFLDAMSCLMERGTVVIDLIFKNPGYGVSNGSAKIADRITRQFWFAVRHAPECLRPASETVTRDLEKCQDESKEELKRIHTCSAHVSAFAYLPQGRFANRAHFLRSEERRVGKEWGS